jgi:transcription termination factor NusB
MGKRTTARRLAMQVLYQLDLGQKDIPETIKGTLETDEFQGRPRHHEGREGRT